MYDEITYLEVMEILKSKAKPLLSTASSLYRDDYMQIVALKISSNPTKWNNADNKVNYVVGILKRVISDHFSTICKEPASFNSFDDNFGVEIVENDEKMKYIELAKIVRKLKLICTKFDKKHYKKVKTWDIVRLVIRYKCCKEICEELSVKGNMVEERIRALNRFGKINLKIRKEGIKRRVEYSFARDI